MPALVGELKSHQGRLFRALMGNFAMLPALQPSADHLSLKGDVQKTFLGLEGMVAQKISHVDKLKTLFSLMFIALNSKKKFQSSSKKVNAPRVVQKVNFVAHTEEF